MFNKSNSRLKYYFIAKPIQTVAKNPVIILSLPKPVNEDSLPMIKRNSYYTIIYWNITKPLANQSVGKVKWGKVFIGKLKQLLNCSRQLLRVQFPSFPLIPK